MAPTLIVLALLALAGVVIWVVRKKPSSTATPPRESDTAWNDPVTPGDSPPPEPPTPVSPTEEPRP